MTITPADVDLDRVDPFAPELRADPHPIYHRLRQEAPVWKNPHAPIDEWVLTRYDDCLAVLRDHRWSSDPAYMDMPEEVEGNDLRTAFRDLNANVLLFIDPPDHTRLRKLVSKAFTPKSVDQLKPRIQQLVDGILDTAQEKGELDLISELAYPLPVTVICELMGVPVEDQAQFAGLSSDASRLLDGDIDQQTAMKGVMAAMQFINYFNDLFEDRRAHPRDDLITRLVQAEEDGDTLTEQELRSMVLLLFIAGHETTMNLIGNGMHALLGNRDQLARLHAEPALVANAVEECLRFDGPVHLTGRVASEELEVAGVTIPKGGQVVTLLAAANRDPAIYAEPDRFDIGRGDNRHLTFSNGIHYCLGASLARAEGQAAIGTLARRFPDMELATDDPQYREHFILRGFRELRLAL